jgi:hypothetical protein
MGGATEVIPAQAKAPPPVGDLASAPRLPARVLGRLSAAAVAIFLRPWLALSLVALVIALPSFLVTDVVFNDTNARLESSRLAEQARAAEIGAKLVADHIIGLQTDLVAMARSRFTTDALAARKAGTLGIVVTEFRPVVGIDREVLTVFIEDARGSLLAIDPPDPTLLGRDFSQRDYFIGVSRGWTPYVSEAFQAAIQGNPPTTVVAVPILAPDGTPQGVVGAAIDLSRAASWFTPLAAYEDVYVLDRKGRLITHTKSAVADSLKDLSADPTVAAVTHGGRVLGRAADPLTGRMRSIASAAVPGVDWRVLVVDAPDKFGAQLSPLLQTILLIRIALILVVLVLMLVISRAVKGLVAQRAQLAVSEQAARVAEQQAASANRRKSEFLANMSHELRTPLNAIIGFSDLLQDQLATTTSDRQKRYLRNVREAGDHLLALINDVLDLSKVEARRNAGGSCARGHPRGRPQSKGGVRCDDRRRAPALPGFRPGSPDPLQPALERGQVHSRRRARFARATDHGQRP